MISYASDVQNSLKIYATQEMGSRFASQILFEMFERRKSRIFQQIHLNDDERYFSSSQRWVMVKNILKILRHSNMMIMGAI